jgi:peptidoglycan hydrolase-like protein with peptidoglycan-binding domain
MYRGVIIVVTIRSIMALLISAALFSASAVASRVHQAPTSGQHRSHKLTVVHSKPARRTHGQQGIDTDRATQIQQALIREHYMTGEATGKWDATTIAAMQKYQADQGWQTKLMPDSRAIKKLGLGPDYSNAINAKTGAFNDPAQKNALPPEQAAAFADAAGVHQ